VASVEHVSLAQVGEGKIEAAAAVLLHSLAYLPRAAQRRLQPWQLVLTLSCMDKMVDSALANELGLQLLHVDSGRAEEVADTVMALLLGLLRHTHVLASHGYASAGWLGTMHSSCRGMRRSKGMVIGIVGAAASAIAVASRCLAFRMHVVYFDPVEVTDNSCLCLHLPILNMNLKKPLFQFKIEAASQSS
jgi:phosphoglycerate dehydrogenase-like enzyme